MARDKKVLPDEGGQYALLRAIFQVSTAHRVNIIVINSPHNLKTTQIKNAYFKKVTLYSAHTK